MNDPGSKLVTRWSSNNDAVTFKDRYVQDMTEHAAQSAYHLLSRIDIFQLTTNVQRKCNRNSIKKATMLSCCHDIVWWIPIV